MSETMELPFISFGAQVINEYLAWVKTYDYINRQRTQNDEQAIINVLVGLGGLIEYNVRAGYQHFARKSKRLPESFHNYSDLIDALGDCIENESHKKLLKVSSQIRNKLMHADFPSLYKKTKEAYEIPGIEFHQSSFEPLVTIIQTTITRYGCNINVEAGTATDSRGHAIPSKKFLPGEGDAITMDFKYFYDSGHFIHVYDVLMTTYESIVFFRYDYS